MDPLNEEVLTKAQLQPHKFIGQPIGGPQKQSLKVGP